MNRATVLASIEEHLTATLHAASAQKASLQESLGSESKSTAGDKHETGRAMIQRELDQAAKSEARADQSLHQFRQLKKVESDQEIGPGSLIETQKGMFFLGLSLGKLECAGQPLFCLSLASPIGQQLRGAKAGDSFILGGEKVKVKKLF